MYTCIFFSIKLYGHPPPKRVTVTQMYICIHLPSLAQSSMVTDKKRSTVTQLSICIHLPFLAYSSMVTPPIKGYGDTDVHIYTCTFFSIMLYGHQKF
jgi:hypothetical protein